MKKSHAVFSTLAFLSNQKAHFPFPNPPSPHLTISSRGRDLAEISHGLLARHPVLPHLLQLALVLLEGFLLVLGDQVVEVGAAVAGGDVPGGTDVEDPVRGRGGVSLWCWCWCGLSSVSVALVLLFPDCSFCLSALHSSPSFGFPNSISGKGKKTGRHTQETSNRHV